jgi:UDP-N-acetylmuramyl pentapeptide phosphotransferase/UDP-N-acetylglucosamine-1-phosphate transferase
MTKNRFIRPFLVVSVITTAMVTMVYLLPDISPYVDLGIISWALFSFLCVVLFFIADKVVNHPERTKFISLTIANMMLKMMVSIGLVWTYYMVKKPQSGLFIVPFLLVYGIFTIFETRFLLQIADQNNKYGRKKS